MFHVPNVGMTLPLNLLFGLAYGGAEAVVDLLVDAIARFVPDEIRDRIDGGVEELVGLPEVGLELSVGLPFLEMESEQRIVKWRLPEIKEEARCFVEFGERFSGSYQDDIGAAFTLCRYAAHKLRRLRAARTKEDEVGLADSAGIDALTCMNAVLKARKGFDVRDERDTILRKPYEIDMKLCSIHTPSPLMQLVYCSVHLR